MGLAGAVPPPIVSGLLHGALPRRRDLAQVRVSEFSLESSPIAFPHEPVNYGFFSAPFHVNIISEPPRAGCGA